MECAFKAGDKVVCVEHPSNIEFYDGTISVPQYGAVYTVREVLFEEGEVWLLLNEITNDPGDFVDGHGEPCFHHEGFRPVVERGTETGMSILRDLLNKADKPAEVAA